MPLLTQLSEFLALHPLTEALLIGKTSLQARLWRDRLSREGIPWLALRVSSVHGLARDALFATLTVQGKCTEDNGSAMERACGDELSDSTHYAPVRHQAGVHAAFASVLRDLAHAHITVHDLQASDVASPERLRELQRVATSVRAIMDEHNLLGTEDLLIPARDHFSSRSPGSKPHILIPRQVYDALTPLERSVVHAACSGDPFLLEEAVSERGAEHSIAAASIRFRATATPAHEFRAALRDIIEAGIPLDEVELVYTDSSRLPGLYELCVETALPCTFAEGIPVQYSKAARTLQRFLEWLRDGDPYPLIRLMYEGIPDFTAFSHNEVRANRLPAAALLRDARIGRGVRATLPRVDRYIAMCEMEGAGTEQLDTLLAARHLIAAICALLPAEGEDGTIRYHDLIRGSIRLMRDLCRPAFPGEPEAVASIVGMLTPHTLGPDIALPPPLACARVLAALKNLRMPTVIKAVGGTAEQSSSPLPGHVFVSDLVHAGISGRTQVFLLGMDDTSMPGERVENPVLPDAGRRRIARRTGIHLPLSADHKSERRLLLQAFLSRCGASLTVSFARRDESRLRAQGPSRELLALFRAAVGKPNATYRDLDAALASHACDVPDAAAASVQEWWLRQLDAVPGPMLAEAMRSCNPMLRSGHEAEQARDSTRFTRYDGAVGAMEGEIPVQSVSALELLAGCPYNYFLRRILNLRPPQSMRLDAGRWLTPREHGSLVHNVLRSFMESVGGDAVPRNAWRRHMHDIIDAALSAAVDDNPPPGEAARKRSERELREACEMFLRDEIADSGVTPLAFELPFPAEKELPHPLTALHVPLAMETPQGEVLLTGAIDRIDMTQDGVLLVTDYKTGKDRSIAKRPLAGGNRLQPAVYSEAVRRMAEASHRGEVRFIYRYLSEREQGRIVQVSASDEDAAGSIGLLLELRRKGNFPHTADTARCGSCDFSQVCGKAETTAARMRYKLDQSLNTELEPLRRLRDEF
jgi:RecB family exonuclease